MQLYIARCTHSIKRIGCHASFLSNAPDASDGLPGTASTPASESATSHERIA